MVINETSFISIKAISSTVHGLLLSCERDNHPSPTQYHIACREITEPDACQKREITIGTNGGDDLAKAWVALEKLVPFHFSTLKGPTDYPDD